MVNRAYEEPEFCEVLERVPLHIRHSLTFEQRAAIAQAVVETRRKHAVDVRIPIPLVFTQLYLVCLVGRDTRRETLLKLKSRNTGLAQWGTAGLIGAFGLAITCVGLGAAYVAKSQSGIDLFAGTHAKDVLQGLGAW